LFSTDLLLLSSDPFLAYRHENMDNGNSEMIISINISSYTSNNLDYHHLESNGILNLKLEYFLSLQVWIEKENKEI
jgi:hypothetical protein